MWEPLQRRKKTPAKAGVFLFSRITRTYFLPLFPPAFAYIASAFLRRSLAASSERTSVLLPDWFSFRTRSPASFQPARSVEVGLPSLLGFFSWTMTQGLPFL